MVNQIEMVPAIWRSGNTIIISRIWYLVAKSCSYHNSIKIQAAVNEVVAKARAIGMDLKAKVETCQWFVSWEINTEM